MVIASSDLSDLKIVCLAHEETVS